MCKFLVTLYMKALLVIIEYHFPKLFYNSEFQGVKKE